MTTLALGLALALAACTDVEDVPALYPDVQESNTLSIVDKNATPATKALYSNLWVIKDKGFMFGHHDDLWYGRFWYDEPGRSDTKDVCGDYPAVFSFDVGEIMDDRHASPENAIRRRVAVEAYGRGEVLIACAHLNNPLTGGDAWDNSSNRVVAEILTEGSATNTKFKQWLDRLADFATNLKADNGDLIPLIFRPFHEHTQSWSWWGRTCCTDAEFVDLWRFTVGYLRDTKGVHNFIYAISPQVEGVMSEETFMFRWPGDDYVDFFGMDSYHGINPNNFATNIFTLSQLARRLNKPCGVTETGVEGIVYNGEPYKDYWTKQILTPATGQGVSLIVTWRNKYDPSEQSQHFYSVFPGHASEKDFIRFYQSDLSIFSGDLPDMYKMAEGITVN